MKEEKNHEEEIKIDTPEEKESSNAPKLLNILLAIIVIITVGAGAIIYYSLYKYSKQEIISNNDTSQEVSTVADIINTAIDTSTDNEENTTDTPQTSTNVTVTTGEADNRKVLNESIIVLYDGLILDAESMGLKELKYIDNSSNNKDKYVITYYNYENYGFKNSTLGTLSSQVVDGLVKIDNVGKVYSISRSFPANRSTRHLSTPLLKKL